MSIRQIKPFTRLLGLIFILSIVAGCSTTGGLTMHKSVDGEKISGSVVALTVTPPKSEGHSIATQIRGQVASQLLGAGLFKSITHKGDQDAEYHINITLVRIKEVSGISRVMLGALAGANKVSGDVKVVDTKSRRSVRFFSFYGESASHPFSGKSDIKDAVNQASEEIINGLLR